MPPQALFGISVALGFVAWGALVMRHVWPVLRGRARVEALRPLLLLHGFRFIGLAFLIPGVVSSDLPAGFAQPAAYGDLVAAIMALLALAVLTARWGLAVVWTFNVWGTVDLLFGFYQGNATGLSHLSASNVQLS
jgi:hypothetical protein